MSSMSSSVARESVDAPAFDAIALGREVTALLEQVLAEATSAVRAQVSEGGKLSPALMEREQRAVHGLAWLAT